MDKFFKLLVDFFFRTNAKRKKFETLENEKVLAADGSKGIMTKENKEITRGADWIISQRAVIFLTNKRIVCGKWNIPIEKISRATLVKIKSIFGGGQVLKIDTIDNESYQFGMQNNNEWINQNVLNITVEDGNVKTSLFSWLLRIIVFGYLIYWLLQEFGVIVN
jgi:hypothetical protein